jgi:hypothetical protein
MKCGLAIFCLVTLSSSALAQYGVSSHRDIYGNLVRDAGAYSARGINQPPVNNGAIKKAPSQPSTGNNMPRRGMGK